MPKASDIYRIKSEYKSTPSESNRFDTCRFPLPMHNESQSCNSQLTWILYDPFLTELDLIYNNRPTNGLKSVASKW